MEGLLPKRAKKVLWLAIFVALVAGLTYFLFQQNFTPKSKVTFGVTFSQTYATFLGLDWKAAYVAILDDLKVDHLRLTADWDVVEAQQDKFDFADLDWQLDQAAKRQASVILVVGRRTPRWPECHDPVWLKNLAPYAIHQQQLELVKAEVAHFRAKPAIAYWQVENEPLVGWFGDCPRADKNFLEQEITAVRSLDSRPVIVTDSGELGSWQSAASFGDVLGVTMYRAVWNKTIGFFDYWFVPASLYYYKAELIKIFHPKIQDVIITELQMEPWATGKAITAMTLAEQQRSFDLARFHDHIKYAQTAGFSTIYTWGVEYWYWLKTQGQSELWQAAKGLWQ